jgi:hypothetical protein
VYWQGFHLYPYVVALLSLLAFLWWQYWGLIKKTWVKGLWLVLVVGVVVANSQWIIASKQRQADYEVNLLPWQDLANVINVLKKDDQDTLFTGPDGHGYVNMVTNLRFGGRQNFHLPWAWKSPQLRAEFETLFATQAPTFVYYRNDGSEYDQALGQILPAQYLELRGFEDSKTWLYMEKEAALARPVEQWQAYSDLGFTPPAEIMALYELKLYER